MIYTTKIHDKCTHAIESIDVWSSSLKAPYPDLYIKQKSMEKKQTHVMGSSIWVIDLLKWWIALPHIPRYKHKMCLCTISATITDLQADRGADIHKALFV